LSRNVPTNKLTRLIYIAVGIISLSLGIIGIILPVLPTTPFILLTGYCFYRGSPRFHNWLMRHPSFGPIIREYSNGEGMKKSSKIKALALTWSMVLLTAIFVLKTLEMRVLILGVAVIGTVIILRLKTRTG
jgi:uncharacterized membrane protein YbaN (DUF454 family)